MKNFVEWLVARRYRMVLLATALIVLPLAQVISQAIVVLAVLVYGLQAGLSIVAMAIVLLIMLAFAGGGNPVDIALIGLAGWVPALGLATVLHYSRSLSMTIQLATVVAAAVVAGSFLFGQPVELWREMINELIVASGATKEVQQSAVDELSRYMPGAMGFATLLLTMTAVFIGRWWQSILASPGAFGKEFRGLRMGMALSLVAGIVFVASALTKITLLENLALVLASGFLLHGLAVVHSVAATLGSFWLVAFYMLLVVAFPFSELAVAGLGYVDNWFSLRSRVSQR